MSPPTGVNLRSGTGWEWRTGSETFNLWHSPAASPEMRIRPRSPGIVDELGVSIPWRPERLPILVVHPTHLQQLFQNLIGNAIEYRQPDQHPVIRVSAERQEGQWIFSVSDNGIGIDPEYKESILALFKRLHTSDEYSCTGIGLAPMQADCGPVSRTDMGRVRTRTGIGLPFYPSGLTQAPPPSLADSDCGR